MNQSVKDKKLYSNFISLSTVQIANYLFPLITIPYLVRVLGAEKFGLISFAQAFILYFSLITNYGFNLSVPRSISINRDNHLTVSNIFNSVMILRILFMCFSFILMSLIVLAFDKFKVEWIVFFFAFGIVVGEVLFPIWFFQGMEEMKNIAILSLFSKLFYTVSVFIFVKSEVDYILVPLLNSIGAILTGLISLWIVIKNFNISISIPSYKDLKFQLVDGGNIFISNIAISVYTISNTFILGLFTNNIIVGYYSAAEKIIKSLQGLLNPIVQSVYPHISKLAVVSKKSAINFINSLAKKIGVFTIILSAVVFLFSEEIINLFLGNSFQKSVTVLKILSFIPFLIGMSSVYATLFILGFGYTKKWLIIILSATLIDLAFVMLLVWIIPLGEIGVSISWLLTEISVVIISYLYFRNLKPK
jgi:PST family polysaccharide transporter